MIELNYEPVGLQKGQHRPGGVKNSSLVAQKGLRQRTAEQSGDAPGYDSKNMENNLESAQIKGDRRGTR